MRSGAVKLNVPGAGSVNRHFIWFVGVTELYSRESVDGTFSNKVSVYGVFSGSHTGEGGPVPATGKSVAADYVYGMAFEGDKIRHLTRIWNDGATMQQLGWG